MRGALLIVTLIALLVVGLLVIKNMTTETEGVQKTETVQKAKDTAREAEDNAKKISDKAGEATDDLNIPD
ncbi:MAG: hypothetical protein ACLFS7_10380 [Desulfosudaceae bacterium]